MMPAALCIALAMLGHMIRDGYPSFQELEAPLLASTRWWERAIYHTKRVQYMTLSGFCCFLGAWANHPLRVAAVLGAAVLLGMFLDQKHAAGQGPDATWAELAHNLRYLAISGTTSIAWLACAVGYLGHDWRTAAAVLASGLTKCAIWPAAWAAALDQRTGWWFLQPTRVAAMSFGAVIGALLALAPV